MAVVLFSDNHTHDSGMRLRGVSATIREVFPVEYTDLAVFITDFGGTSISMFVLALLFWLTQRRESVLVVSYAIAGVAFIISVKALIGMPRPPEEVYLIPYEYDKYGFPSGHAFASALVYGGLIKTFSVTWKRVAILGASVLITLISLSRVVLGLHYLGDVIVGAVLGVGFLLAIDQLVDNDPQRGFAIGLALVIPALFITGFSEEALLALGGAVGGLIGTTRLEDLPPLRSKVEGAVLASMGCGAIVAARMIEPIVASFEPAIAGLYALLFVTILLAPIPVRRGLTETKRMVLGRSQVPSSD